MLPAAYPAAALCRCIDSNAPSKSGPACQLVDGSCGVPVGIGKIHYRGDGQAGGKFALLPDQHFTLAADQRQTGDRLRRRTLHAIMCRFFFGSHCGSYLVGDTRNRYAKTDAQFLDQMRPRRGRLPAQPIAPPYRMAAWRIDRTAPYRSELTRAASLVARSRQRAHQMHERHLV